MPNWLFVRPVKRKNPNISPDAGTPSPDDFTEQRPMPDTEKAVDLAPVAGPLPVILFADIVGSTTLYETLGDTMAKSLIDEALNTLATLTKQYDGRVIKTIGDEVMCLFPSAEKGFHASISMQQKIDMLPTINGIKHRIRIGFHGGPLIEKDGDVFGDTVNIAARMSSLAKGMQIMITRSTVDALPTHLRWMTRSIAAVAVKGKKVDLAVCEILWRNEGGLTRMMSTQPFGQSATGGKLILQHGTQKLEIGMKHAGATIGRDPGNDIVVADIMASRHHARIEKRRDKFYLADHSTNGTIVRYKGEADIGLRREEIMLRGSGHILFGCKDAENARESVEFHLRA